LQLTVTVGSSKFLSFVAELEQRHLAELRFSDVTRALRALSSAYVERRESALAGKKALDGTGKRAAFALYYGPIHFLLIQHIARQLAMAPSAGTVVDLGCGTGVAAAAVAMDNAAVLGIDTHPWALDEARLTYRAFGLKNEVRRGHAARIRFPADTTCVVAAFVVNELNDADRGALLEDVLRLKAAAHTARVLIVEPISTRVSPWWPDWERVCLAQGGRSDEWRVAVELPPIVKRLAKAAGLRPQVLTARSVSL
jgi:SAM-dependent methyltransferase